jgi:cysteine desulfurase/selenocysteine lyase
MSLSIDPAVVRKDFPILDQLVNGRPLVYLDNAATSQKPVQVLDALERYYRCDNANVHRGIHELSRRATLAYEGARSRIGRFIGVEDPGEIVFTRGTTESLNLMAFSWGLEFLKPGDEVLLTGMEHHSNVVPWQLVARRTGAKLRWIELDDQGRLRTDALDALVTPRTRLVTLVHVSNALGTVNPLAEIVRAVRARSEAVIVVDGAQAAPHLALDMETLGCDAYAFSGHKMCGPTGIGVLWARRSLLEAMPPFQGGGEMIKVVEREEARGRICRTSSRRARPTSRARWGWAPPSNTSSGSAWSASAGTKPSCSPTRSGGSPRCRASRRWGPRSWRSGRA